MAINEKYSYKDFTGLDFSKVDAKEFNGTEIIGSCFSQLVPMTKIFPAGMTGVSFVKCNLDNIDVPVGNTMDACCNQHWKEQNDRELWVVDTISLQPIEPLCKQMYQELKISIDPVDIPIEKMDEPITSKEMGKLSVSAMGGK